MRLTKEQQARLLMRLAEVIFEEVTTDGHHELVDDCCADSVKARQFVMDEAKRLERRAWVLRGK